MSIPPLIFMQSQPASQQTSPSSAPLLRFQDSFCLFRLARIYILSATRPSPLE